MKKHKLWITHSISVIHLGVFDAHCSLFPPVRAVHSFVMIIIMNPKKKYVMYILCSFASHSSSISQQLLPSSPIFNHYPLLPSPEYLHSRPLLQIFLPSQNSTLRAYTDRCLVTWTISLHEHQAPRGFCSEKSE